MKQTNTTYFSGFREWLITNEGQKDGREDTIPSYLRSLENDLSREYVQGRQIGLLHDLYAKLSAAQSLKKSAQTPVINDVKRTIGGAFRTFVENKGNAGSFKGYSKSKIDNYKSAFILYVQFLSEFFGFFTVDELVAEGIIKRTRKGGSRNSLSAEKRMPVWAFQKGIAKLMRKFKVFAEGDNKMITMPLDKFHEILEAYASLHGADGVNDILKSTSFMQTIEPAFINSTWESVLIDNVELCVDDRKLCLEDVSEVKVDSNDSRMTLLYTDGEEEHYLPQISASTKSKRELSMRLYNPLSIGEQKRILDDLRGICYRINQEIRPYFKVMSKNISDEESKEKQPKALSKVNYPNLIQFGYEALEALKQYASCLRVELVLE